MVQPSRAEGGHHLVQAGADARDLRFGDARVDPECSDQVVDGAGGHARDVGVHHHGVQRLVDTPAGLEDQREERALAQLRDSQVAVTGRCGQHQWPSTVALATHDPDRPRTLPDRPAAVIYAIQLPRPLTPESLFTFAQVTLVRAERRLRRPRIPTYITDIPTTDH